MQTKKVFHTRQNQNQNPLLAIHPTTLCGQSSVPTSKLDKNLRKDLTQKSYKVIIPTIAHDTQEKVLICTQIFSFTSSTRVMPLQVALTCVLGPVLLTLAPNKNLVLHQAHQKEQQKKSLMFHLFNSI
jgi:hypothetical protein